MKNFKTYGEFVNEAYSDEERKELAEKGFALSDGSFPIKDLKDLKNAIQAYGRAKDQSKAAKFIVKRAKALGAEDLVPDTEDFQKSLDESVTNESTTNEAMVQVAGNKKPSGAKVLATVIIDYLEAEGYFKSGFKNVKKDITSDVQDLIIKSTF